MKAMTRGRYGSADVLALDDITMPVAGDDEVLIRVRAAGVGPDVWHLMTGRPYFVRLMGFGLRKPKARVVGRDVAGSVEAVGRNVTEFQPGDEVFGTCRGALAEYACTGAGSEGGVGGDGVLAAKPANLSFEQAAGVPTSAQTALQGLRDAGAIRAGQSVLIIGASGGVGTFAVQLAKVFEVSPFLGQQLRSLTAVDRREDLLFLKDLIEAGKVTPVISNTYPLNEAPKALSDADEGHGRGKAVITV